MYSLFLAYIPYILGYFFSFPTGNFFKSGNIAFKWFIPPIIFQSILIFIMYKKIILKLNTFLHLLIHITYASVLLQFGVPHNYDSIAFAFVFTSVGAIMLIMFKFKRYVVLHFYIGFLNFLLFFIAGKKLGYDEYSSLITIATVLIFFPMLNLYLNGLKNNLTNRKVKAENLSKQISSLVENLEEGFMIIGEDGLIEEGATKITEEFFETQTKGKHLGSVLKLNENEMNLFNKWIENIWKGNLSFKDLASLGPQDFRTSDGRYITLDYKPIYLEGKKKKIDKVICIATDKTQEMGLEKELELDKEKVNFVNKLLQNPVDFGDLMNDTYELFEVYPVIKDMDEGELFRKFHTLKARYGQFGLREITVSIDEVENCLSNGGIDKLDSKVKNLQEKIERFVKRNHLVIEAARKFMIDNGQAVLVKDVMKMIKSSKTLENLKFDLYKNYLLSDIKEKFERYKFLVDELAEKQNKFIDVLFLGDKVLVEYSKFSNLVNVCIHIFRNMVDHGIESEDERIEKIKPERGKISVKFKNEGDYFYIDFTDDGKGIDPQKIKEKLIDKGIKKDKELEGINDSNLVDMIFLPGLSTKEEVTDLSGRGIGMDAVREEVERLGGKISVISKIDKGTTFTIKLPVMF